MITGTFRDDMLSGRVALVVGGTSGIGAGVADALATVGAVVTVTGATAEAPPTPTPAFSTSMNRRASADGLSCRHVRQRGGSAGR